MTDTTQVDPMEIIRPEIASLPPYITGIKYDEVARLNPDIEILRLGSNENLYGPSPDAIAAIQEAVTEINLYPDNTNTILRQELSADLGFDGGRLLFSNGSEAILSTIIDLCVRPGDKVVTLQPSFPIVEILTKVAGGEIIRVPFDEDLTFSVDNFCDAVKKAPRLIYLCTPNNPTGTYFTADELTAIAQAAPSDSLFVVDEAYAEFGECYDDFPDNRAILEAAGKPYIVLRTFSKAYGLAAMRIGYGICYSADFAGRIASADTVFNVGLLAQKAALAAWRDQDHKDSCLAAIKSEKARTEKVLSDNGHQLFKSGGNFSCINYDAMEMAVDIQSRLRETGIFVKSSKGVANDGSLRVTTGQPEQNDRFLEVLSTLK